MNIAVLLPLFVEKNHPEFSSLAVGILFSSYQIVALIVIPITAEIASKVGRKKVIVVAVFVSSIATATFGLAALIDDGMGFYAVSLVARMMQGAGDALLLVAIPAIVAIEFTDK